MSGLQPRYSHGCNTNSCVLVGQLNEYDVYFCESDNRYSKAKLILRFKGSYEQGRKVIEALLHKQENRWTVTGNSMLAGTLNIEVRAQLVRQAMDQFINKESLAQEKFSGALERLDA